MHAVHADLYRHLRHVGCSWRGVALKLCGTHEPGGDNIRVVELAPEEATSLEVLPEDAHKRPTLGGADGWGE
jgi:hypothetical protein